MINIQVRIHDKFSIEMKTGLVVSDKARENNFNINTWVFLPNSLDINPSTYTKSQFYKDVKSNIRLITPIFILRDIAGGNAVPLRQLEHAFDMLANNQSRTSISEYEYQIKMFTAIFKSSVRDQIKHIATNSHKEDTRYLCDSYIENIDNITSKYRELRKIINIPTVDDNVMNYFLFGDEFMTNVIELYTFKLINILNGDPIRHNEDIVRTLTELILRETEHKRRMGYIATAPESPTGNRELIFRQGVLKKYVESDLFLNANKKRDGVWVEQIYYSLAAGLSMVFATTIAFSVQQKYGNFTMPLFVALVVSYMLKDRIKDLMRYYFAHKVGSRYFDNKTTISIKENEIGWSKEWVDFISEQKTPKEVMDIRNRSPLLEAENRMNDEKIILYRKSVMIDREQFEMDDHYTIAGINDIVRLHLNSFTQKMDNPEVPLYVIDEKGETAIIEGEKIYYINLVMQFQSEDQNTFKRYRLVLSRNGIRDIEEFV